MAQLSIEQTQSPVRPLDQKINGGRTKSHRLSLPLRLSWRHERASRWWLAGDDRIADSQRLHLQADFEPALNENIKIVVQALWDDFYIGHSPDDIASLQNEDSVRRKSFFLRTGVKTANTAVLKNFDFGTHFQHREYRDEQNRLTTLVDVAPYFWKRLNPKWSVGYDLTLHRLQDDGLQMTTPADRWSSEHRLNLKYSVQSKELELNAILGFDLDRLGSGETWEGGALQLKF